MKLGRRVWRTNDGRLVLDGDLDAAFLVYGEGDDVPDDVAAQFAEPAAPSEEDSGKQDDDAKQAKAPANKAKGKPADKSGS